MNTNSIIYLQLKHEVSRVIRFWFMVKEDIKFSFFWKIGQIWWLIFLPVFFLHWLSPFLAGILSKTKKWIYWSIYYLLTVILLFVVAPLPDSAFQNLAIGVYVFSWLGCFIHSIIISVKFIGIMKDKKLGRSLPKQEKLNREHQKQLKGLGVKHKKIMHTMLQEKKEIMDSYNNIDPVLQGDMLDILEMVETYIEYARELMAKEEEIDEIVRNLNIPKIESRIKQLKLQVNKTTNYQLKNEYLEAIDNYQKQKDTYYSFIEKRKLIDVKLESNISKLREIKYDLIELKYKDSENDKDNIFKKINNLSEEMNVFVDNLKDTHQELKL